MRLLLLLALLLWALPAQAGRIFIPAAAGFPVSSNQEDIGGFGPCAFREVNTARDGPAGMANTVIACGINEGVIFHWQHPPDAPTDQDIQPYDVTVVWTLLDTIDGTNICVYSLGQHFGSGDDWDGDWNGIGGRFITGGSSYPTGTGQLGFETIASQQTQFRSLGENAGPDPGDLVSMYLVRRDGNVSCDFGAFGASDPSTDWILIGLYLNYPATD